AIQPTLVVESDHQVAGAAIYWVDGLRDLGLERSEGQAKAAAWLSLDHALEPADRNLAAQLSTLIAFDYLIGNWDRWSGGNLKSDASGEHVILRDHDAAFAARLGEPLHRRMLERLVQAQRFSRSFYRALRSLTRQTFTRELALDPAFGDKGPPLDPAALEALFDRRETLISHIAATIEERGETNVLAFP
ncbi:MAG TPA: hypothetical protein VHM19_07485, partial [Polyangiales bacterium]|nr:hypothetical protein [Polyangiales bacterium]